MPGQEHWFWSFVLMQMSSGAPRIINAHASPWHPAGDRVQELNRCKGGTAGLHCRTPKSEGFNNSQVVSFEIETFIYLLLIVCLEGCACVPQCMSGGQRAAHWSGFSLRIKLRLPGLAANTC